MIKLIKERNDADSFAKDKKFTSNIKSQKIKVLKSQLKKKKGKKPKILDIKDRSAPEKNYLSTEVIKKMPKNKSHRVLPSYKSEARSRYSLKKSDSDSGVSDINEEDFYDSQFDRELASSRAEVKVTLPKILNKSPLMPTSPSLESDRARMEKDKSSVYQSWAPSSDGMGKYE